jgi:hypothetical protein
MLFDEVFQHHEQQLFQEVGNKATGLRSTFPKQIAQINTAGIEAVYRVVNMNADEHVEFQVCLSDTETEAATRTMTETDRVAKLVEKEIYGITFNEQMRFKKKWSIHLIQFQAWW